ncbi:Amino-acid acetyltransferase [subsurface metagenome]
MNPVERARISDVAQMHELINSFAEKGEMLARSLSEIYENVRDYFVVREGEQVVACAALHVMWSDLAEIKSVVVAEGSQGRDLQLGIPTIFCLTYKPAFFESLGFSQLDKMELPRKVWSECYRCPKFPDCDEVALICHLEG